MLSTEQTFKAKDGIEIFYRKFLPEREVLAVVQIFHGMAEHSQRYTAFANYLTDNGFAVYIADHRGHGRTIKNDADYGVWTNKDEWWRLLSDQRQLQEIALQEVGSKPYFILGHSMGSFLARTFITLYSNTLSGVIISGTGTNSNFVLKLGKTIADIACCLCGDTSKAHLLDKLSFGSYNKGYSLPYQWLSRDENEVLKYSNDNYCGGLFSNSFYRGFFSGLLYINKKSTCEKIDKQLNILFVSGTKDPVGNMGNGVKNAVNFYRTNGLEKIELKLYSEARHEILNETNRKEVYEDLLYWLRQRL